MAQYKRKVWNIDQERIDKVDRMAKKKKTNGSKVVRDLIDKAK